MGLTYAAGESWESMRRQGVRLLQLFAQDQRVRILQPAAHLQMKVLRPLNPAHDFIGFIDAVGELDGVPCLLDWKTSSSCYPAQPQRG